MPIDTGAPHGLLRGAHHASSPPGQRATPAGALTAPCLKEALGDVGAIHYPEVVGALEAIRQLQPAGQVFDESDDSIEDASRPSGFERDLGAQASSPSSQAGLTQTVDVGSSIPPAAPTAEFVPSPRWCGGDYSCSLDSRGAAAADEHDAFPRGGEWRTTLMIQRIAPELDQDSVRRTLDAFGLAGRYDAVHVPINYGSKMHMRYAFVNFYTPEDAALCISACTGKPFGSFADGSMTCNVAYAHSQRTAFTLSQAAKSESSSRSHRRRAKQRLKQLAGT